MPGLYRAYIVAGPNGAGKTTFARQKLLELAGDPEATAVQFLNADEIERRTRVAFATSELKRAAGRELLRLLHECIALKNDFMLETTLSSKRYALQIPEWRSLGYHVELTYLQLASVDDSIARVRRRVAAGGHNIPEADLRRRFVRSLENLGNVYKAVVDKWTIYDSLEGELRLADTGGQRI